MTIQIFYSILILSHFQKQIWVYLQRNASMITWLSQVVAFFAQVTRSIWRSTDNVNPTRLLWRIHLPAGSRLTINIIATCWLPLLTCFTEVSWCSWTSHVYQLFDRLQIKRNLAWWLLMTEPLNYRLQDMQALLVS